MWLLLPVFNRCLFSSLFVRVHIFNLTLFGLVTCAIAVFLAVSIFRSFNCNLYSVMIDIYVWTNLSLSFSSSLVHSAITSRAHALYPPLSFSAPVCFGIRCACREWDSDLYLYLRHCSRELSIFLLESIWLLSTLVVHHRQSGYIRYTL